MVKQKTQNLKKIVLGLCSYPVNNNQKQHKIEFLKFIFRLPNPFPWNQDLEGMVSGQDTMQRFLFWGCMCVWVCVDII